MCKCCQTILESCYWHCFEKWWCYDDKIATYQDTASPSKDSRSYDNLAFWDSVSVLANRSVVTIQPLPEPSDPATKPDTTDTITLRKKSTIEEKIEKQSTENQKSRKTLKDRRNSAANLKLYLSNDFQEIPIIRQNSMPKFYMETPDVPVDYENRPRSVLMSPVLPNTPTIHYDLKSIVQFEKEQESTRAAQTPKRLTQIRRKIKPMLSKKPSTKSLPDSVNYI